MQLLYSAPAPQVRAHLMPHVTILNRSSHFFGGAKLRLECSLLILQACKQRAEKKICELKGGNIGIVEKAHSKQVIRVTIVIQSQV